MGKKSRRPKGNAAPPRAASASASTYSTPNLGPSEIIGLTSLSIEDRVPNLDELVARLLSAERVQGVPQYLLRPEAMKAHLLKVMQPAERVQWLVVPLMQGLMQGHPYLDIRLQVSGYEPTPVLMWVCQWKLLQPACGWKGGDEFVSMVLAAGVDINAVMPNKCNATFFAVKYGSPTTVDLLIKAGINIQQLDIFGRTCLWNALEYPSPEMLRCLLDHLPVTETFPVSTPDGAEYQISAADRILNLFSSVTAPISWTYLGPPSLEDVAESSIILRQRGAHFTNNEVSLTNWAAMGYVARGGRENVRQQDDLKQLAKSLLGFWFPSAIQMQFDAMEEIQDAGVVALGECPICLNPLQEEVEDGSRALELYCHHVFCQHCIVAYGSRGGTCCPICRHRLCKEIAPRNEGVAADINSLWGLMNSPELHLRGPSCLTDDQVLEEAKIQGLYTVIMFTSTLRAKLLDRAKRGHEDASNEHPMQFYEEDGDQTQITGRRGIELSATNSIMTNTLMLAAPRHGPAMIEIQIKGVPVVARLSNNSFYTCISSSVVNTLRLKRLKKLSSKKFRDGLTGTKLNNKTITCLEEFTFSLDGIEITIRNAVEVDPDLLGAGVQLGQDFFLSAAWCLVDVECGAATDSSGNEQPFYTRTDAMASWFVTDCKSESLRYYGHDGMTAHVPLLHYNPHKHAQISIVTLKPDTTFNECNWCLRTFPKGMAHCTRCFDSGENVYYCDERCQKAAWKVHKVNCKARGGN